jgi:hypothetical protein
LAKEKTGLINGLRHVRESNSSNLTIVLLIYYPPPQNPDIIALLIVGVIFVGLFLFWQHYLEKRFDDHNSAYSFFMPPPLIRISLWSRANGRLAQG